MGRVAVYYAKYPELAEQCRAVADPDSTDAYALMPKSRWLSIRKGVAVDARPTGRAAPEPPTDEQIALAEQRAAVCEGCDKSQGVRLIVNERPVYNVRCEDCGCGGLSLIRGDCPQGLWP